MSDGKASEIPDTVETMKLLVERWKLFSEASHKEKQWMHERLNWLLVSQPVLITALVFAMKDRATACAAGNTNLCEQVFDAVTFGTPFLGLLLSSIVLITLSAAGRMHWSWTSHVNEIAGRLARLNQNIDNKQLVGDVVSFGSKPHWPARTSSLIPPFVASTFLLIWTAYTAYVVRPPVVAVGMFASIALLAILILNFAGYFSGPFQIAIAWIWRGVSSLRRR